MMIQGILYALEAIAIKLCVRTV